MLRLTSIAFLIINCLTLRSQTPFDILPDVGGIGGQAICFIVFPDTLMFTVVGHRYDTLTPGPNTKPWIGEFSYEGDVLKVASLIDTNYNLPFYVINSQPAHKQGDIYYYYARRDIGGTYLNPYLVELNIQSGKIIRSKMIINDQYSELSNVTKNIVYDGKNNISLTSTLQKSDSLKTFITLVDTGFNIKKVIEVKEVEKWNYACFTKFNTDKTYTVIGTVKTKNNPAPAYYQFYLNIVDSLGNVLEHSLAPTSIPIEIGVSDTYTVTLDKLGNWIIAGVHQDDKSDSCANCHQSIPYIFSTTPHFDSLLWQTRFYDIPEQLHPRYFLYSITEVSDGFIVAGNYLSYSDSPYPKSGVLLKASLNGDSIWMKHYIPVGWENERVAYAYFNDIKATPDGSIVVVGAIGDLDAQVIRPWILHLDSDGCLVPGCNTVGTDDNNFDNFQNYVFKVFPNPSSGELYLLSSISENESINVVVTTGDGTVIKRAKFNPVKGGQYRLSTENLVPGVYHLILTNEKQNFFETHNFIRN